MLVRHGAKECDEVHLGISNELNFRPRQDVNSGSIMLQ